MEAKTLTQRHKRLLSSLFFVLEQKTEAIEHMLNHSANNASYSIKQDLSDQKKEQLSNACKALKHELRNVADKFDLNKRNISQYQYISTIQSQMWENVTDAFSDKLKGYGKEVVSKGKEADPYIQNLSDLIEKLSL